MHLLFALLGSFCLVSYLLTVVLLEETIAGLEVGMAEWFLLELAVLGACAGSLRRLRRKGTSGRQALLGVGVASATLTVGFFAADLVSYFLAPSARTMDPGIEASEFDENSWVSEWYPRLYYPSRVNFRLYKPSYSVRGRHFGSFYRPYMMASPTLAAEVFEEQEVEIHINELGFREQDEITSCRVFAIGDSFTFGYGVTDSSVWVEQLQSRIGECVYNLGVNDASPKQELELLRYVLESESEPRIERLIWMIYEGNDLEDSYADQRPEMIQPGVWEAIEGTVIGGIFQAIAGLKEESIIDRLRRGALTLDRSGSGDDFQYVIDGVRTPYPIVHSETLGYLLLYPSYVRTGYADAAYFENHPNMPALRRVFEEMRTLSLENGFDVTVVTAPTTMALYAPYFSDLASLPAERYFARLVDGLALSSGFESVDLFPVLAPAARSEMLYFRDDGHWTPRGNEIVAAGLAAELKGP